MVSSEGKTIRQFECNECLFTGDTLFSGGAGRFFEGEAEEMVKNFEILKERIPKEVPVFNGH